MASSRAVVALFATLCLLHAQAQQYSTMSPLPTMSPVLNMTSDAPQGSRSQGKPQSTPDSVSAQGAGIFGASLSTQSGPQGKPPMTDGNMQSTKQQGPGTNQASFNSQGKPPMNGGLASQTGPRGSGKSPVTPGTPPSAGGQGPTQYQPTGMGRQGTKQSFNGNAPNAGGPSLGNATGQAMPGSDGQQIPPMAGFVDAGQPAAPMNGMPNMMNPRGQPGMAFTMGGTKPPKSLAAMSGMKPEMFTKVQSFPKPPMAGPNGMPMMGPDGKPMTPFQSVLEKLRQNAKPETAQCRPDTLTVDCGMLSGIFFKLNEMPFQRADPKQLPMDVPEDGKLVMAVCGYGNQDYVVGKPIQVPLVPTLIRNVGEKAYVSVHIQNSANMAAYAGFILSTPSGAMAPNFLIAPTVLGEIGEHSYVSVNVKRSGNVVFDKTSNFISIELKSASLVGPLIKSYNQKCIEKACLSIDIQESANIFGSKYDAEVSLNYASLVSTQLESKCMEKSMVRVSLEKVGNIARAKSAELEANSFAINTAVKLEEAEASNIAVKSMLSGNILVKEKLELTRVASLFQSGLMVKKSKDTSAKVDFAVVANIFADMVDVENARIISDVIEMSATKTGMVHAMVKGCGNVLSDAVVMDSKARCIDDVLDLDEGVVGTLNLAELRFTCNIRAKNIAIKDESLLIETIMDVGKPDSCAFAVELDGVANTQSGEVTKIARSALLGKMVNIEDGMGPFKTKIDASYAANSMCQAGFGESVLKLEDEAKLVDEVLDVGLETKEPNVVNAVVDLKYVGNAFISSGGSKKFVSSVFNQASVGADNVMIEEKTVGKALKCFLVKMPMGRPISKSPMA